MLMLKKIQHLILILVLTGLFTNSYAQTNSDYEAIYNRLFALHFGSGGSYSLSNLNTDGTFKNVSYPTVKPTVNTGDPRPHLFQMTAIAKAYNTQGSQYKSVELMQAYIKAWNWWRTYNPSDTNWWWRTIGWPNSLIPSFVLMCEDLKTYSLTDYNNIVNYLMAEWTTTRVTGFKQNLDGANTSDVCSYIFATSICTRNISIINESGSIFNRLIDIVTGPKSNGVHVDYSFSQHTDNGRMLYWGNYGKEFIGGLIDYVTLTTNTFFEIPATKMTIFENYFLEGLSWISYRNMIDQHQLGRKLTSDGYTKVSGALNKLLQVNTPQKEKLQTLYNWMTRSTTANAINVQRGNRMFWRHDYMVHKGTNYFTTARMTSTRVTGSESGNGEGLNNYYTGAGVNYVYVAGTEYSEIINNWNWRRLPGITAPQRAITVALPLVEWGANGRNLNAFAGGVSDGLTGASGFIFSRNHSEINLTANKSWFFFEDYIVALGSDIKAGTNYNIPFATTINQVKYKTSFFIDNNGTEVNLAKSQELAPTQSNWAHINNVGYHFINNSNLQFEVRTLGNSDIAWIGVNHGNFPVTAKYAYAIYPNITKTTLQGKVTSAPYIIVSNSSTVQAVADTARKIVQAIFFKPGRINLPANMGFVETSEPIALQLKWMNDSLRISVANPYCESVQLNTVSITIGGLYEGEGSNNNQESQQTTIPFYMPSAEYSGSSMTLNLKQLTTNTKLVFDNSNLLFIRPNKVKSGESFTLKKTSRGNDAASVEIFTLSGQKIKEERPIKEDEISINTSGFTPSMYIVRYDNRVAKLLVE